MCNVEIIISLWEMVFKPQRNSQQDEKKIFLRRLPVVAVLLTYIKKHLLKAMVLCVTYIIIVIVHKKSVIMGQLK